MCNDVDSSNANNFVIVSDGSSDITDDVMKGSDSVWESEEGKITLRVNPVGPFLEMSGFSFMVSNILNFTISAKALLVTTPLKLVKYKLVTLHNN